MYPVSPGRTAEPRGRTMGPAPPADRSCATPTPPTRQQWSGRRLPPGPAGSDRRPAPPRPVPRSRRSRCAQARPARPPPPRPRRRQAPLRPALLPQAARRGPPAAAPSPCSHAAMPALARPHRHQPRSPSPRYKILSLPRCLVMATRRSKMAASSFLPCALPLPAGGTAPVYTHHVRTSVRTYSRRPPHVTPHPACGSRVTALGGLGARGALSGRALPF